MTTWLEREFITGPHLALCLTDEDFQEACAWMNVAPHTRGHWLHEGGSAATHWFGDSDQGMTVLVTLGPHEGKDPIEVCGLLVHEATHVFQFYMEHIGEHKPSREFMAYSIQSIAVQLMQAYTKQTAKQELEVAQNG